MTELTHGQQKTRQRVEGLIALAAPALDLVLAAGERISRIAEPEDYGYYPARPLADEGARPPADEERAGGLQGKRR